MPCGHPYGVGCGPEERLSAVEAFLLLGVFFFPLFMRITVGSVWLALAVLALGCSIHPYCLGRLSVAVCCNKIFKQEKLGC